jgi:CubicO group peptidase (beta-lactamase class C family)
MRATFFCFTAVLFLSSGGAAPARQSAPDFGEVEKVAIEELHQLNTPGAAIGIVSGDRLVYAKGVGISDVETGVPVSPEMLFRLGSTTKMSTAAARGQQFIIVRGKDGKSLYLHSGGRALKKLNSDFLLITV